MVIYKIYTHTQYSSIGKSLWHSPDALRSSKDGCRFPLMAGCHGGFRSKENGAHPQYKEHYKKKFVQSNLTLSNWANSVTEISSIAVVNLARRFLCAHLSKTNVHKCTLQYCKPRGTILLRRLSRECLENIFYTISLQFTQIMSAFFWYFLTEISRKNKIFFQPKTKLLKKLNQNTLTEGYRCRFREGRRVEHGLCRVQLCRNRTNINNSILNMA